MLIVCTNDARDSSAAWNRTSTWGEVVRLDVKQGQDAVNEQFISSLKHLKPHEQLGIVGYGGDKTIYSQPLGQPKTVEDGPMLNWSARDIAILLLAAGQGFGNWSIPTQTEHSVTLLFHLMSKTPCNFLTNVMLEVLQAKTSNFGIASYGYTSEVDKTTTLPGPFQLKYGILPQGMTSLVVGRL